jgi:HPr kinase/phosphorylase
MPRPAPQPPVAWNLSRSLPFLAVCSVAATMLLHASAAARGADAVLFLGPPGAGKSDLVLRLIGQGWHLVADDQTRLLPAGDGTALHAEAPEALRGMLEVRGLGLFAGLPVAEPAPRLRLAVHLAVDRTAIPRLPEPATWAAGAGPTLPAVTLHAFDASTPAKVGLALDAATGRVRQQAGAFA